VLVDKAALDKAVKTYAACTRCGHSDFLFLARFFSAEFFLDLDPARYVCRACQGIEDPEQGGGN
jgi:hypothetical protein